MNWRLCLFKEKKWEKVHALLSAIAGLESHHTTQVDARKKQEPLLRRFGFPLRARRDRTAAVPGKNLYPDRFRAHTVCGSGPGSPSLGPLPSRNISLSPGRPTRCSTSYYY